MDIQRTKKYFLEKGKSESICIEFQSDNSNVYSGFEYEINVKYDLCVWDDWVPCYTMNLVHKKWGRGINVH